jgi:hypothetical protein
MQKLLIVVLSFMIPLTMHRVYMLRFYRMFRVKYRIRVKYLNLAEHLLWSAVVLISVLFSENMLLICVYFGASLFIICSYRLRWKMMLKNRGNDRLINLVSSLVAITVHCMVLALIFGKA